MLLFTSNEDNGRVIIPLSRIYEIESQGRRIRIAYESGEIDVSIVDCPPFPKLGCVVLTFDTEDEVDKVMRQFYKACRDGARAFYFGK